MPNSFARTTAARSGSASSVSSALMRTNSTCEPTAAPSAATQALRATSLRSAAAASSRSRIRASAELARALAILRESSPGTNNSERIIFSGLERAHREEAVLVGEVGHQLLADQ